ncbi:hypothetical protein NBRC110019_06890 [Neptunitalea chrysea]|uniref:Uncharacterized protein n=1 Tax=Neptunitalea chrysea TaxID=1647581 RepID=A0A9W6ETB8_9FLAO|nr:hypothetical protein [Neptunitalea chrysea]GLB51650.1 hypothetical protein NBRC110019_06890 [Neptunitalea chrysea]
MRLDKDKIDDLFGDLQGSLDIHEPSENHMANFERMLQNQQGLTTQSKKRTFNKTWWYVAASIVIMFTATFGVLNNNIQKSDDLASVAPKLYESQTYFTGIINQELEKLQKENNSPETKQIVDDAVKQVNKLENDYKKLKTDLIEKGTDKRVIYAMISNLQRRIELLQQVLQTIDDVKTIKTETHENIM